MIVDKSERIARVLCILSTILLVLSNIVLPAAMLLWFDAATPRQQDVYALDVLAITFFSCGACMLASLVMSIIARLKEPGSKWALVCIIISAILLVTGILAVFFTIWAASQYHYYG